MTHWLHYPTARVANTIRTSFIFYACIINSTSTGDKGISVRRAPLSKAMLMRVNGRSTNKVVHNMNLCIYKAFRGLVGPRPETVRVSGPPRAARIHYTPLGGAQGAGAARGERGWRAHYSAQMQFCITLLTLNIYVSLVRPSDRSLHDRARQRRTRL